MKQIVCVKWGRGYGVHYVNRLYGMAARHVTPPFRLVCLTDDREGVRREVECFDLPELGVPHPQRTIGKWRKQVLWGRELPGLDGVALYIDLDSVIVGSLDPYFEHGQPDDVILARNWSRPLHRLGQTSVFRFRVGSNPHLIDAFRADPQGTADKYRFEQHYVTARVAGGIKFWPGDWTCLFRLHCLPPFPLRYFAAPRIPRGARIVTFAGGPKPDDVLLGRWNDKSPPHPSRWSHLKSSFGPGRVERSVWRHLKGYVLPAPWLAESWVE
ncbi:MAG TPA: glycosyl transferase [Rubrivivax sp.]|nr:glycosyl transferase [Rubrivivax sp.]